jgi:hypothetical protein
MLVPKSKAQEEAAGESHVSQTARDMGHPLLWRCPLDVLSFLNPGVSGTLETCCLAASHGA